MRTGWLAFALLYLVVMAGAIKQIRDNRKRGVGVEWTKTFATAGGVLLVTALGIGALLGAFALNAPTLGGRRVLDRRRRRADRSSRRRQPPLAAGESAIAPPAVNRPSSTRR
jgi:hypothetical protein